MVWRCEVSKQRHTTVRGDGTDCTALLCNEWRNKGKFWQNGETSSRRNDAYRSGMLEPRDKIITEL